MAIILQPLRLKITQPKKQRTGFTKISKIQKAVVVEEDGIFKACVEYKGVSGNIEHLVLPFTPRSFEIENRVNVFTKRKDEHGRTRLIRTQWKAKFHPGSTEYYLPFDANWTIKGYIVVQDFVKYFDFTSLVGFNEYKIEDIM